MYYEEFQVNVNYDRSIADGIRVGNFNSVDAEISNENITCSGSGNQGCGIILLHFDREMRSSQVLYEMMGLPLRPVNIQELLAINEAYPGKMHEYPIVALGTSYKGKFPCLFWKRSSALRQLLLCEGVSWVHDSRFAAVRVKS